MQRPDRRSPAYRHVTPGGVLHSNLGSSLGTSFKSTGCVLKVPGQQPRLLERNLLNRNGLWDGIEEALQSSHAIAFADTYVTANMKSLTSGGVSGTAVRSATHPVLKDESTRSFHRGRRRLTEDRLARAVQDCFVDDDVAMSDLAYNHIGRCRKPTNR